MKVSVCIPTYNQADYLEATLKSVLNQSLKPFEIIVSNDCSTDNTKYLLDLYSKNLKNITVVHQKNNLGIAKNVDACLRMATGDYVLRIDSDDFLQPEFIEKLTEQLNLNPDAGYAHAAVQEIDQFGFLLKVRCLARKSGFQSGDDALIKAVKGYKVAANIVLFRRSVLETVNYISCKANFAEDYYLASTISSSGYGNVYLNEILSNYRVWADSGKIRQKRKLEEIIGLRMVIEEVLDPAFRNRNWDLDILKKTRTSFALSHISCLGWNVYSNSEKNELKKEIYRLSSNIIVKVYAWIYLHKLGFFLNVISKIELKIKQLIKHLLFGFNKEYI